MDLSFQAGLEENYGSASQKIRVLSENWFATRVYCPNYGFEKMKQHQNNRPAADFRCAVCHEDYELKSKKRRLGRKVVDGAYGLMMERLTGMSNPNLSLLSYDPRSLTVVNFVIVPKYFFGAEAIQRRKPLSTTARRAGWVGCNILLDAIPEAGRIFADYRTTCPATGRRACQMASNPLPARTEQLGHERVASQCAQMRRAHEEADLRLE